MNVCIQVYFQTLPFLTLLSLSEVEAIVRNAESLLDLHERISDRIELVEQELRWREDEAVEGQSDAVTFRKQWKVRKAAQRIAKIFVNEVSTTCLRSLIVRSSLLTNLIPHFSFEQLPNFHLYNDFCARHAEAMDITRRLSNRPEWEAYERQCALRAATQGDMTPLASRSHSASASPFFQSVPLPPLSTSVPLPPTPSSISIEQHTHTDSPADSPTMSIAALPVSSSVPTSASSSSTAAAASARRSRAKLRFSDFAIAPIQRIMRYPMVFGSLAKYCGTRHDADSEEHALDVDDHDDEDEVTKALAGLKKVAEAVDEAKREREGEIRTRIVASRMEFQSVRPFLRAQWDPFTNLFSLVCARILLI